MESGVGYCGWCWLGVGGFAALSIVFHPLLKALCMDTHLNRVVHGRLPSVQTLCLYPRVMKESLRSWYSFACPVCSAYYQEFCLLSFTHSVHSTAFIFSPPPPPHTHTQINFTRSFTQDTCALFTPDPSKEICLYACADWLNTICQLVPKNCLDAVVRRRDVIGVRKTPYSSLHIWSHLSLC